MDVLQFTIEGGNVESFSDFVDECNLAFINRAGGNWQGNLDAFNDYLSWPEPNPYELLILRSDQCRQALGHAAAAERLKQVLTTCHPSNVARIQQELADANAGRGQTLFETILEIVEDNREWVHLVLE